jgi:hypothetical protein
MNENNISGTPDYYFDENGMLIFTEKFLLSRGGCCGMGCLHCPYDFINVLEPKRTELLEKRKNLNGD